jgi:hypothetical protein
MSVFRPKGHRGDWDNIVEFECPNAKKHEELLGKLRDIMAVDCAIDQGEIPNGLYGDTVTQTMKDITEIVDKVHAALAPHLRRIIKEREIDAT